MACALNVDQIKDLYGVLYGEILDRIKDKKLPKFDINQFAKELYDELMDPAAPTEEEKALLYIQAVPDIFLLVAGDAQVQDYIIDNDISLNDVIKLSRKYAPADLKAVKQAVTTKKKSNAEIKVSIAKINAAAKKLVLTDPQTGKTYQARAGQNKARVTSPLTTTAQQAVAANPETLTEEERNKVDEEKAMFYTVIKNVAYLANAKDPSQQDVEYNGVPVRFKPQLTSAVNPKYFTTKDKEAAKKFADGVTVFLSDTDGNILFFNEEGEITDEKSGRPVYQYIRKVNLKDGKLLLSNRADFYYTLVSPEEQVEQMRKNAERNKIKFNEVFALAETKRIAAQQKKELNQLYQLRQQITENPKANILLPITGGSTGYVQASYKSLADTDITVDEITDYFVEETGAKSGFSYFILSRTRGGIGIDTPVYMQRGDMTEELADKIAQVLTTEAKLDGEQLNPYQREDYAKTFLDNRVSKNRMKIEVEEREGIPQLIITVYPTENDAENDKNGVEVTTAEEIKEHLMNAVIWKGDKKAVEEKRFPANISYNKKYIGGKPYVEYTIVGDKITASEEPYFDTIKPFIKIEVSKDSFSFFSGFNAYLSFAMPENFTEAEQQFEPGFVINKTQKTESKEKKTTRETGKKKDNLKKERSSSKKRTFKLDNDKIIINVAKKRGIGEAAKQAISKTDGSLSFSLDFETSGEKLVKRESSNYFGVPLDTKKKAPKNLTPSDAAVNNIVSNINKFSPSKLYVSGSNIAELEKAGYTQEEIDTYMSNVLKAVTESKDLATPITEIVTIGQTGIAEAFVKAAAKLGIPATIVAPTDYTHIVSSKNAKEGYKFENDKEAFISRFGELEEEAEVTEEEVEEDEVVEPKPKVTKKAKKQTVKAQQKRIAAAKEKTKEERKEEDKVQLKSPIDSILGAVPTSLLPPKEGKEMKRAKGVGTFLDRVFTTAADKRKADEWFKKTFRGFEGIMPLERITAIVNSDAYATWSRQGITLYEGDGGTSVDLYHEAWHGFSQLFLTYDEKVSLYSYMRDNYPKWEKAEFEEIEEAIAEDFRSFMKFKKKFPGIIGRIFEKLGKILRKLFGKLTRRDFTLPRDIPMVRELYDNLYNGNLAKFSPDINNAMPEFTVLNRAKTVQLTKKEQGNFQPFSLAESDKAVDMMDGLMALTFRNYAQQFNAPTAVDHILTNPTNRKAMYDDLLNKIDYIRQGFIDELSKVAIENVESEEPNTFLEAQLMQKVEFLTKVIANFGNIEKSLDGKQKSGVVAYHMKNSRFSILKKAIKDLEDEDASNIAMTQSGRDQKDNTKSSKEYASAETMMLLSSISKQTGKYNADGTPVYERDEFGIPMLEDPDLLWNRLARILANTMDPNEMYNQLIKYQKNYPEFSQILTLLPTPLSGNQEYKTVSEFEAETKFWQDLKKPIIKFKQLTINKTIIEKGGQDETGARRKEVATYESRLARADFDVYSIITDWKSNFVTATPETNPYVGVDSKGVAYLNIQKVIRDLSVNGTLPSKNSIAFLKALGINLDMNSVQINSIVNDPKSPFNSLYGVNTIFGVVQLVNEASMSNDSAKQAAAEKFKRDPMYYLLNGLPSALQTKKGNNESVRAKIRILAELQNEYSDGYSNFSTLTPEGNKVWEQFLDSTITRVITSINRAETWQELTDPDTDVNGKFKHMRWLSEHNNPHSKFSVLLNSIFYLDPLDTKYGTKRPDAELNLNIVGGTQLVVKDTSNKEGVSTSSADLTTKFLQELHTMLSSGIEEFMRHASKNTAMSLSTTKLLTYAGKDNPGLYVDTKLFRPSAIMTGGNMGETQAFKIIAGYMAGEFDRIRRFKANTLNKALKGAQKFENWAGYNRVVGKKNGKDVLAGEVFAAFDDVIENDTKQELYDIIDEMIKTGDKRSLVEYLETNEDLRLRLKEQTIEYFNKETKANTKRLQKARYLDPALVENLSVDGLTRDQVDEMLIKSYTYNSWMHKYETTIIAYGDLAQYNHSKEEFHKRNAGLASGGRGFRADQRAQIFVNNKLRRYYAEKEGYQVRNYDGTLQTVIMQEKKIPSIYYDEYFDELVNVYTARLKESNTPDAEAKAREMAKTSLEEYEKMKEADGQGHISFESYRMLKYLEGNWTDEQEELYRKVSNGVEVSVEDIVQFFPPYKVQYFGNIQVEGLPLTSFHKFSLAPLIPTVHTMDSNLGKLHDMMMKQQIDYVLFETGSKVGHVTSNRTGDVLYNKDNETINTDLKFTVNTVFAEFLKNQTEVNREYKKKSIFSTQLRKLILEGLYEQGVIDTTDEDKITVPIVRRYIDHVEEYTNLLKEELLNEIGFEERNGEYVAVDADSNAKLLELIRKNLERDDVLGDHLIDLIDINEDGTIAYDLSIHPEAAKIEKVLLSILNKRIIKQKVKGEPLVQVSGALYEGIFDNTKYKKGTDADVKKYVGTNFLPTYHKLANGKTAAMKTMVALQGDFVNLLKLEYKGKPIETIDRLNEAIKDDEWLDQDDNRKAITMVGVRIPVQGLNSMEFMEVYHFLPAEAGNIIIPPAEIVAKSGGDFDIDKMTVFMPTISGDGEYVKRTYNDNAAVKAEVALAKAEGKSGASVYAQQKAGLENELIEDIRAILELPSNYSSLVTPNGTFLLKGIADDLAQYVTEYSPFQNRTNPQEGKVLSPTRVLESEYNLYKHESNVIGKRTLGLGAIENTFNVVFNSLGAKMPLSFLHGNEKDERKSLLFLKHNTISKDGKEYISLSNRYDVDNVNKIADVFSQMINGWVDVEKDAWIFFIQGNYEVAPILLYLLKTGVPVKDAIYFVSQPLVRDYVNEQRLIKSTFADPLRRKTDMPVKYAAASNVISKYFENPKTLSKGRARYDRAINMSNEFFKDREKSFTTEEMYNLIKDFKANPEEGKSELSQLMFLHFLQIENQIQGITQLKMNSNPDTATDSTLFESEETLANLEALETETKVDQDLFSSMLTDSIISSFFNQKMALGISKPLFPLRYHPAVSKFIMDLSASRKLRDDAKLTFGENNVSAHVTAFRNDVISYIFQNALRKYKLTEGYRGYDSTETIPVALVQQLKFGAFVKEDESGAKTLYIDRKALQKEFAEKAWLQGSESKNSYQKRGLFTLNPQHFMSNGGTNFEEYLRFIAEREFLRHLNPIAEYIATDDYKQELKITKILNPSFDEADAKRETYERFLAHRALDNTFNPYHLFKDPNYSFATRFGEIMNKYPELAKKFKVLQRMKIDPTESRSMFNLYLSDKEMTNNKAGVYHSDLIKLADPNVEKVPGTDNQIISDFFTKLSIVGFLQSGLSKSKYSFTNIADFDQFISIMQQEGHKFIQKLNNPETADILLKDFYAKFKIANRAKDRRDMSRFKNYLTKMDLDNPTEDDVTGTQTDNTKLEALAMPGVFMFKNMDKKATHYKALLKANPNVVFFTNEVLAKLADESKTFAGESLLASMSDGMAIRIPTSYRTVDDNLSTMDPQEYERAIERFERRIQIAKEVLFTPEGEWTGAEIAFSDTGYGDPTKMPQKLFVYLSRRLYEEFGYLNPGSELYKEIEEIVIRRQGISDQEIIEKFDQETSDPFKCD